MMLPLESYHSDKYFMFCHNNWEIKSRNTAFTDQSDLPETCHDCCGLDTFIRPTYHVEGWHMGSCFPDLGHKQTVCQPRTNQINQNWPTSRIHTPESAASLPKNAHIWFIWAIFTILHVGHVRLTTILCRIIAWSGAPLCGIWDLIGQRQMMLHCGVTLHLRICWIRELRLFCFILNMSGLLTTSKLISLSKIGEVLL